MKYMCHKLQSGPWKLDPDPLKSARMLLERATLAGGLKAGSPPLETIEIPLEEPEKGFETFAFAIPGVKELDYIRLMREFAMDSTCEY